MKVDELPALFRLAKHLSKLSDYDIKMGAIIADKHYKPVGMGFNKNKTHPKYSTGMKLTIHAEASAIINSGRDYIKDGIIFVYRESKSGQLAMARPCEYCMKFLKAFGINRIYYTTNEYPYWDTERI